MGKIWWHKVSTTLGGSPAFCRPGSGLKLASGGKDNTALLWDARTHALLAVLPHGGTVCRL